MLNDFNLKKDEKNEISQEDKEKVANVKKGRKQYKLLGYNYKNETLIELLCITKEEMRELRTIIDRDETKRRTNIRTNEHNKEKFKKQRRNKQGLTLREQKKLERINEIKKLLNKGLTQKRWQRD